MHFVTTAILVAVMLAASVWDVRERRIPNILTIGGIIVALLIRAVPGGYPLLGGVAGIGVALLIAVPLFALGGIGGGDAKLLAAAGAFLGPTDLVWAFLATGIVGGLLGIVTAARNGGLLPLLVNTKDMMLHALTLGRAGRGRSLRTPGAVNAPYGLAIAIGCLIVWFSPLLGGTI